LANGRGIHGASTAELAVAGILALVRGLPFYLERQRAHDWRPAVRGEVSGRRALVLGAGDIGSRVAAALELLGASTTVVARSARPGVHGIDELSCLLGTSELVVVTLPHTPQTDRLVDDAFLKLLPDGAILVNVARGALVDTDALVRHLMRGRLSAFLDVTDPEPLPPGHPLWDAPNVMITPHVGGGTERWRDRARALLVDQVSRFVEGRPLVNVVHHPE
jgi:phosphoglycerate dehydrogenase-like enzyme